MLITSLKSSWGQQVPGLANCSLSILPYFLLYSFLPSVPSFSPVDHFEVPTVSYTLPLAHTLLNYQFFLCIYNSVCLNFYCNIVLTHDTQKLYSYNLQAQYSLNWCWVRFRFSKFCFRLNWRNSFWNPLQIYEIFQVCTTSVQSSHKDDVQPIIDPPSWRARDFDFGVSIPCWTFCVHCGLIFALPFSVPHLTN